MSLSPPPWPSGLRSGRPLLASGAHGTRGPMASRERASPLTPEPMEMTQTWRPTTGIPGADACGPRNAQTAPPERLDPGLSPPRWPAPERRPGARRHGRSIFDLRIDSRGTSSPFPPRRSARGSALTSPGAVGEAQRIPASNPRVPVPLRELRGDAEAPRPSAPVSPRQAPGAPSAHHRALPSRLPGNSCIFFPAPGHIWD